jgi:hypothetical protein
MNRIEHAVAALTREAERGGKASGFVIVWYRPHDEPSHSGKRLEVRLFVSMAVRNPCRPQEFPSYPDEFPSFPEEEEDIDFVESNSFPDDTAVRLLLGLELGENPQSWSPESEGTWDDLRARLEREDACILRFDGFGEIGDQVSRWRTQKRHALRPIVPDITALPAWHPLTWLCALESLIDSSEQEDGDPVAWHAFSRGEGISKLSAPHLASHSCRHFGQTVAQVCLARTWCDFFATHQGAPQLQTQINHFGLRNASDQLVLAIRFAFSRVAEEGMLASLCFALGYYEGSGHGNVDDLVSQRHKLRMDGISLPQKLDAKVDALEHFNKLHLRLGPAT